MWDWIASRPRYCLKIGLRDVAWAKVSRDWRGRPRYQSVVSPLPEGAMRLSPLEQNILLPAEMESQIRSVMAGGAGQVATTEASAPEVPRAATVILPDLSVRFAVLTLQDLPWSSEERDAVVRWRLGQDQLLSLSGAKVFSQVLSEPAAAGEGPYSIFAVVVQEAVLAQYESVCEAAGLIPQEIDVSSLRLFNLWARASGGPRRITTDYLWVNATDGGFTAFVFQKGQLVYVRSKLSAVGGMGLAGADTQWAGADRIVQECADSIYACQQQTADLTVSQVVMLADEALEKELQNRFEKGLGLPVKTIEWDHITRQGKGAIVGSHAVAALPAIAGVM
jgi:hypothetical protein